MLQQTRVETMVPYYHRFLHQFPDVHDLAKAPLESVLTLWSGLGYYRRARLLHSAAQIVSLEHNGILPANRKDLLALPGIGPYTAGAILSIAFNQPEPILDGNVIRVLTRILGLEGDPAGAALRNELWSFARTIVPQEDPGDFNQGLMELGATLCSVHKPRCSTCPLRASCRAFRSGNPESFPQSKPGRETVHVSTVALVVTHAGRFLLVQRDDPDWMTGLWEFPTWTVSSHEDMQSWISQNAPPDLGFKLSNPKHLGIIKHSVTHHQFTCCALQAQRVGGGRMRRKNRRWMDHKLLGNIPLAASARKISSLL